MSDCYCDYEPPSFCRREIRKARKPHKCDECSGLIAVGEHYEHVRGKWEGAMDTFNTCERCVDIRTWTENNVPCLCWAHGNMIDDCRAAVEEAVYRAKDETIGLRFGLLRRIVLRDRLNASRRS
jgi:hypothetical protein